MESCCRKRKRVGGAGEHVPSNVVGMQEVPLPGWIDLNGSNDSPLPPGWERCLDLQSGKMYFVNSATQTRILEDPQGVTLTEPSTIRKGDALGEDMTMMQQACMTTDPKTGMPCLAPSVIPKGRVFNHCNSLHVNPSYDIWATNHSSPAAPFIATSTMAAIICVHCHTLVMVSRQSPQCPNCKKVCYP